MNIEIAVPDGYTLESTVTRRANPGETYLNFTAEGKAVVRSWKGDNPSSLSYWLVTKDNEPTEKDRRVYYQNIVYDVLLILQQSLGRTVECGTVEKPSTEVQDRLKSFLKSKNDLLWKLDEAQRSTRSAVKELARIAEILECKTDGENISYPSNIPNVARDRMAELKRFREELESPDVPGFRVPVFYGALGKRLQIDLKDTILILHRGDGYGWTAASGDLSACRLPHQVYSKDIEELAEVEGILEIIAHELHTGDSKTLWAASDNEVSYP